MEKIIDKNINTIILTFKNGLKQLIDLNGNILFDNLTNDEVLEIWQINGFIADISSNKINRIK